MRWACVENVNNTKHLAARCKGLKSKGKTHGRSVWPGRLGGDEEGWAHGTVYDLPVPIRRAVKSANTTAE